MLFRMEESRIGKQDCERIEQIILMVVSLRKGQMNCSKFVRFINRLKFCTE